MKKVTITKLNKKLSFDASMKYGRDIYVFNADCISITTNQEYKAYICVSASLISLPEEYPFIAYVRATMMSKGLIATDKFIIIPNHEFILN